jgi:predicted O-methyltransferase YrrM
MAAATKESSASPTTIEAPGHILSLLTRLHKESLDQETLLKDDPAMASIRSAVDPQSRDEQRAALMKDKFIALDADKAAFMYSLVRAMGVTQVVEVGTSYGVSTIYLALAVGQNAARLGKEKGKVVATEHESEKAEKARAYWRECGEEVEGVIELRVGDLRETFVSPEWEGIEGVEFVLMDSKFSEPCTIPMTPNE